MGVQIIVYQNINSFQLSTLVVNNWEQDFVCFTLQDK